MLASVRLQHDTREFKNQRPLLRRDRMARVNKDLREKAFLEQRPVGAGHKYINYGRNIASMEAGTAGYMSDRERFSSDFASDEYERRKQMYDTKQQQLNRKRYENAVAEEQRWNTIDKEHKMMEHALANKQVQCAPANESSVPYDPLTLQYRDNEAGNNLRVSDDQIRYRAALRAKFLQERESIERYHPITGQPIQDMRLPDRQFKK